jgi:hypothetical protein
MNSIELIVVAASLGILISRTTLLEKVKVFLTEKKITLIVQGLDCPYCASFWSAVILNAIFFSSVQALIVNALCSALLGYFVAKD